MKNMSLKNTNSITAKMLTGSLDINRKTMAGIVAGALLTIGLSSGSLAAEPEEPLEKLVSELADKPEQHAAIANYYQEKAAAARKEAAEHKRMGKLPIGHNQSALAQKNWRTHCEKLSASLEATAKEYDALAKLHEGDATPAKSGMPEQHMMQHEGHTK